jgi:tetratricopeptide (TPR) repeat protein
MAPRIVAVLALFLTAPGLLAQENTAAFLGPAEILKLMEASPVHYLIESGSGGEGVFVDPYGVLFPDRMDLVDRVVAVEEDGRISLRRYELDETTSALMKQAEERYAAEDAAGARVLYRKALDRDPNFYQAYAYIGDTYIMEKDAARALAHYDTAVALNPTHYQGHFFRASALMRLGRAFEAREEFIKALALNPRHASSVRLLRAWSKEMNITLADSLLTLRAVAYHDTGGIHIVYDAKAGAHWLIYGMAKGMWLGEPEHRRAVLGDTTRIAWSTSEERECLGAMLGVYASAREEGDVEADPELDRILRILEEGYLTQFLLYEFGARINPLIMMTQPKEQQQKMEEFVARFVIPKREK